MANYSISYTSSSEGITVGVSDDTLAGALDALVKQFGDGVVPLVASTIDELKRTADAVEEVSDVEELRQSGVIVEARSSGSEEASQPDLLAVPDDAEPPPVPSPSSDRTGSEEDQHFCSVCGDAITADRAKASNMMIGEDRCADCTV